MAGSLKAMRGSRRRGYRKHDRERDEPPGNSKAEVIQRLQETAGNKAVVELLERAEAAKHNEPVTADCLKLGISQALQEQGQAITADHVAVSEKAGKLLAFNIRLGGDGHVLPSAGQIMRSQPRPGTVSGAQFILLGTVQQSGQQTRLTMRVVVTESGVVIAGGMGDTVGGGILGVLNAARHALPKIGPLELLSARL